MIKASFVGKGLEKNNIFDENHFGNRDDCYRPYIQLRKELLKYGCELNTSDLNKGQSISFCIHQDVQERLGDIPHYLLLLESPVVKPEDHAIEVLKRYDLVFTWNSDFFHLDNVTPIFIPNPIKGMYSKGFSDRTIFSAMIAGNKAAEIASPRELYTKRIEIIRWYETNAPDKFALYGSGWDVRAAKSGIIGKVLARGERLLNRVLERSPFPSFRGALKNKIDILGLSKFSFCLENVQGYENYITEKIFDAFFCGSVPIYTGAPNINDLIPTKCFIDLRDFRSIDDLHKYLISIDEYTYADYQGSIQEFLQGPSFLPFGSEYFSKIVTQKVLNALKA